MSLLKLPLGRLKQLIYSTLSRPAFNIADTGICVGVATLFWVTWQTERAAKNVCKVEGL